MRRKPWISACFADARLYRPRHSVTERGEQEISAESQVYKGPSTHERSSARVEKQHGEEICRVMRMRPVIVRQRLGDGSSR